MTKPYPRFKQHRIQAIGLNWRDIKTHYSNRCATCGSKEGESHLHWPGTKTVLQQAHKNPEKPLNKENVIPQCQKCNRADRNKWIYDDKGRVVRLADATVIKGCSDFVQKRMYAILYKKYKGKAP